MERILQVGLRAILWMFPFYIDKGNRFYHSILQSKKNQNGNVFLSEDIIVKVNPDAYY